ncbi:MAG: RluA family pseudouridine synthase [Anaerolineales bacterium]|nr:RluA family pseudouridine synthase [Anaerolineales bacterium]
MDEKVIRLQYDRSTPQRLDKYLTVYLSEYSRARIQRLIKNGKVLVNEVPARKTGQMVEGGDMVLVTIPPVETTELQPEEIPLDIIFENSDVMVINKPAGMVVHPAAGHNRGTLVHAALAHAPDIKGISGEARPGVVHRLDKNTSGLILMAKNDTTHHWLQEQFRQRKVKKTYLALVDGKPPTPSGKIDAAIGRDASHRKQMAITPPGKGRNATSEYRTIENYAQHTLLEVQPATGRTHQIRLHLAFIGCPVVGDIIYGRKHSSLPMKRHFLHAARLIIYLPGELQPRNFSAPLPPELEELLKSLREK